MIQYPNIYELIAMLSVSPATGPLERSYAKLAKICYKDRNALQSKNIEILYLLAVLQIDNNEFFYQSKRDPWKWKKLLSMY